MICRIKRTGLAESLCKNTSLPAGFRVNTVIGILPISAKSKTAITNSTVVEQTPLSAVTLTQNRLPTGFINLPGAGDRLLSGVDMSG